MHRPFSSHAEVGNRHALGLLRKEKGNFAVAPGARRAPALEKGTRSASDLPQTFSDRAREKRPRERGRKRQVPGGLNLSPIRSRAENRQGCWTWDRRCQGRRGRRSHTPRLKLPKRRGGGHQESLLRVQSCAPHRPPHAAQPHLRDAHTGGAPRSPTHQTRQPPNAPTTERVPQGADAEQRDQQGTAQPGPQRDGRRVARNADVRGNGAPGGPSNSGTSRGPERVRGGHKPPSGEGRVGRTRRKCKTGGRGSGRAAMRRGAGGGGNPRRKPDVRTARAPPLKGATPHDRAERAPPK